MMDDTDRHPLELLAEEYTRRLRKSEQPSLEEYVAKHPELENEIRDLFPTIAEMETLKRRKEQSSPTQALPERLPIERLGDFRIVREIGRGGMGIVYEAEQESLHRRVAVKVLPSRPLLDSRQYQRFEREARTAAKLHHTNIVPVFGVGRQDAYHYYVMQFIDGVGLNEVLNGLQQASANDPAWGRSERPGPPEDRRSAVAGRIARDLLQGRFVSGDRSGGQPRVSQENGLPDPDPAPSPHTETAILDGGVGRSPNAPAVKAPASTLSDPAAAPPRLNPGYWRCVARIGLQVASALHYAHQQGTLHRDIKPGNLLLDSQGFVWVADFGLAKTMEEDSISRTGDVVGTLRYMAPEQFSGESDARSDLYSLGLTLYELLTLRPAYQDSDSNRLIHAITQGEPPRPRKVRPEVPRDLETIVLKSVAREPDHRYRSAGELAVDLQRFLDDLPILARRISVAGRLWRWSRRNRVLAATAGAALALLILLPVVTTVGYLRTEGQRAKAEANSDLALGALDRIFDQFAPSRIVSTSTLTLSEEGSENTEDLEVPIQPVLSKQAATLLEQLLKFYDRLAEQGGDDSKLRRKVAEANRRIGDIRQRLGNSDEARAAYLRALEVYGALERQAPGSAELSVEEARIQNELGCVSRSLRESGRPFHEKALSLLQSVSDAAAGAPLLHYELARTHYFLAKRSGFGPGSGGPPRNPTADASPPRPSGRQGAESSSPRRQRSGEGRERFRREQKEQQEHLEKAIGLLEGLTAANARVPDYRHLLALCYRELGSPPGQPEGSRGADRATAILQKLVEDFPEVPDFRYDLSETYAKVDLRHVYFRSGASAGPFPKEEVASLERALEISEALVADHPNVPNYAASQVQIRLDLSMILSQHQRLDEAEAQLRKGKALQSMLVQRYPQVPAYKVRQAMVDSTLAKVFRGRKELPEARSLLESSVRLLEGLRREQGEAPGPWRVEGLLAMQLRSLAGVLDDLGEKDLAAEAGRKAEALAPRSGRPTSRQ